MSMQTQWHGLTRPSVPFMLFLFLPASWTSSLAEKTPLDCSMEKSWLMAESSRPSSDSPLPTWFRYTNANMRTHPLTVLYSLRLRDSPVCFQDDILMGTLSVRENLLFSANLRLNPKHHSSEDKNSRVNTIIQDLGLTDCADTKVRWSNTGCISLTLQQHLMSSVEDCKQPNLPRLILPHGGH